MTFLSLFIILIASSQNTSGTVMTNWSEDIPLGNGYTSYPNQHNIVCDDYGKVHISWFSWEGSKIGYNCYNQTAWINNSSFYGGWGAGHPSIAVSKTGTDVYICWQYNWFNKIVLKRLHNGIWEDSNRTISESQGYCYSPSMTCDANNVLHIVWEKNYEIHYRKFDGSSLSQDIKLSNSNIYAAYPDIASSGNKLTVSWVDMKDGNFEIYLREYSNLSWQPEIRVSNSNEASLFPSISIDSTGKTHIVWQEEQNGGYKIFYTSCFNGTLDTVRPCVESSSEAINPSITSKENKSWLVWADSRNGEWEIYYKELNNDSMSQDSRLTFANGNSNNPDITADKNLNLYVLFSDTRNCSTKVYFKEKIAKNNAPSFNGNKLLASPNPFTERTLIQCDEKQINGSQIKIYDINGRLVKSFNQLSGIIWNGRNENGKTVSPGIYFVKLNNKQPIKLVKLR